MPPGELRRRIMGDDPAETPEWVVLAGEVRSLVARLRDDVEAARQRFAGLDDVRQAIAFRDRTVPRLEARVAEINKLIAHLNLVVPHMRFQRVPLDAEREVAPLARSYFRRPAGPVEAG